MASFYPENDDPRKRDKLNQLGVLHLFTRAWNVPCQHLLKELLAEDTSWCKRFTYRGHPANWTEEAWAKSLSFRVLSGSNTKCCSLKLENHRVTDAEVREHVRLSGNRAHSGWRPESIEDPDFRFFVMAYQLMFAFPSKRHSLNNNLLIFLDDAWRGNIVNWGKLVQEHVKKELRLYLKSKGKRRNETILAPFLYYLYAHYGELKIEDQNVVPLAGPLPGIGCQQEQEEKSEREKEEGPENVKIETLKLPLEDIIQENPKENTILKLEDFDTATPSLCPTPPDQKPSIKRIRAGDNLMLAPKNDVDRISKPQKEVTQENPKEKRKKREGFDTATPSLCPNPPDQKLGKRVGTGDNLMPTPRNDLAVITEYTLKPALLQLIAELVASVRSQESNREQAGKSSSASESSIPKPSNVPRLVFSINSKVSDSKLLPLTDKSSETLGPDNHNPAKVECDVALRSDSLHVDLEPNQHSREAVKGTHGSCPASCQANPQHSINSEILRVRKDPDHKLSSGSVAVELRSDHDCRRHLAQLQVSPKEPSDVDIQPRIQVHNPDCSGDLAMGEVGVSSENYHAQEDLKLCTAERSISFSSFLGKFESFFCEEVRPLMRYLESKMPMSTSASSEPGRYLSLVSDWFIRLKLKEEECKHLLEMLQEYTRNEANKTSLTVSRT